MTTPIAPTDHIWDVETYPNVFTLSIKHALTGNRRLFEISNRRNDLSALTDYIQWLQYTKARMVGFNNQGFDYPVLHYILTSPVPPTPFQIYQFAIKIIKAEHGDRWDHIIWDRDQLVPQIDLFKIHHFDNKAKTTSLKMLEFNMRSDNVQDLPFPPGTVLTDAQIDTLIQYNNHDVDQTEAFYYHSLDAIHFREELTAKYNRNFLNHNDTKIGKDYFIMELERLIPGCCYTVINGRRTPRQTPREQIALRDVIFPWIRFKRPQFQRTLDWLNAKVITETKGILKKAKKKRGTDGSEDEHYVDDVLDVTMPPCVVNGFRFVFGTGGIHGSVDDQIIYADDENEIIDLDVSSYYPNLAIANRLYPAHLGEQFCDIYLDVYNQRKQYAKDSSENGMLKLALNGTYGDSNNPYSPFYDPQYTMSITINGQLLLCLLADYLMDIPEMQMIQINTDGLTFRVPRTRRPDVKRITDWWQAHTLLELEEATYSRMCIRDCNSYIAIGTNGKLKRKGAYEYNIEKPGAKGNLGWHQNHSALVIPMAAEAALVHGESVRDFILNHDNIYDFMLRTKVPRTSRLVLQTGSSLWPDGEQQLQNICRYYVSRAPDAGSLIKIMPPLAKAPTKERRIGINVGWNVTECNDIRSAVGRDINFEYYITEAEKLVLPLMPTR
jgi:hypothetical protein